LSDSNLVLSNAYLIRYVLLYDIEWIL